MTTTNNPQPPVVETPELLTCPFCRHAAVAEEFYEDDDPQPLFVVTCEVCPVKTYDQFSANEAARIWNTRPTPDFIAEKARRVVDAFNDYLMQQFVETLTTDSQDALTAIITTEFGAGGGQGENKS